MHEAPHVDTAHPSPLPSVGPLSTMSDPLSPPTPPVLLSHVSPLNQYINDSERYFKSNTAFKFLPGTHHMNKPLHVGNVHSMSLESFYGSDNEQPHLVGRVFPVKVEQVCACLYG